jgi:alcohol dehydrogenase (cytochrome c)
MMHSVPVSARLLPIALALCASIAMAGAAEVTPERLLHAADEPQNWLMNLGSYSGSRYSGLDGIDRDNVGQLVVRYSVTLGGIVNGGWNYRDALPLSPLVEDGYIYIADGWGRIYKLDARRNGAIVWQNDGGQHNLDGWLQASRGLAFYGDFLISTSADGRLHWIDKETGEVVRSVSIADPAEGYTIAASPLVVGDRIIVGGGGADRGARGRIDAVDARTGEPLWHVDSLSPSGQPGEEDAWLGGGAFAQTGVYDPASGLSIWGAGHPLPRFGPATPPGDNGYTNSALAIDVATGSIAWHFQYTPGGATGFSEGGTHHFVPSGQAGADLAIAHFGNNGFYYLLDGGDGSFHSATQHVDGVAWTTGIDPQSGRPAEYVSSAEIQSYRPGAGWHDRADCPNIRSTPAFASAYSPRTGLSYGSGADGCLAENPPAIHTPSSPGWLGAYYSGAAGDLGMLTAIDPASGTVAARRIFDFPLHAGALATAGGLVFTTSAEGTLHALDDETLEPLWSTKFGSLTAIPPISFAVDGEQFIAVVVGGNAFSQDLSYRPPEMSITQPIFVLAVLGLRP